MLTKGGIHYTVIETVYMDSRPPKVCRGVLSTLYTTDEIEYILNVLIIECSLYVCSLQLGEVVVLYFS